MRTWLAALALSLSALFPQPSKAQAAPAAAPAPTQYRVLLVGNAMSYTNNLPALLRAIGAAQGTPIITETFAAPGGTLSDRLNDGHASAALARNHYDVVLLQEQGGNLAACQTKAQRSAPCVASRHAYKTFAEQARASGAKILLFASWGPDRKWDGRLMYSIGSVARAHDAKLFNAAGALNALRKAQPEAVLFPEPNQPSIQASLMLALALYRDITGNAPSARDLQIRAPLLPYNTAVATDRPLEAQSGLGDGGAVTVVPGALIAPLIQALPSQDEEQLDPRRRR